MAKTSILINNKPLINPLSLYNPIIKSTYSDNITKKTIIETCILYVNNEEEEEDEEEEEEEDEAYGMDGLDGLIY